jgi:hypothetical protein
MARRDRVPLTTPRTRTTLKGWRLDQFGRIDFESGTISGSISFYDTLGQWVESIDFSRIGVGGDIALTVANMDAITTLLVNRLKLRDPTLAGTQITDTVVDINDTVINP